MSIVCLVCLSISFQCALFARGQRRRARIRSRSYSVRGRLLRRRGGGVSQVETTFERCTSPCTLRSRRCAAVNDRRKRSSGHGDNCRADAERGSRTTPMGDSVTTEPIQLATSNYTHVENPTSKAGPASPPTQPPSSASSSSAHHRP